MEIVRNGLGEWEITTRQKKTAGRVKSPSRQEEKTERAKPPKLSLADQVHRLRFHTDTASIPSPTECLMAIDSGIQRIPELDIEIKEIFYNTNTIRTDMIPKKLIDKATSVKSPRVIKSPKIIITCKFFKPEEHPKPIHSIIEYDDGMAGAKERLDVLMERGYSPEIVISFYQPLFPSLTKSLRE
jgi:hypothetical protein